jgi:hypothetical protein
MKKEKALCERRCPRWWLNTEDSTGLWSEELLLCEIDLFNRREVDRGSLDRIGSLTQPRPGYGCLGGGVMLRMLGRMGCPLRVEAPALSRTIPAANTPPAGR